MNDADRVVVLGGSNTIGYDDVIQIGYDAPDVDADNITHIGANGRLHLKAGSDANTNSYVQVDKVIFGDATEMTTAPAAGITTNDSFTMATGTTQTLAAIEIKDYLSFTNATNTRMYLGVKDGGVDIGATSSGTRNTHTEQIWIGENLTMSLNAAEMVLIGNDSKISGTSVGIGTDIQDSHFGGGGNVLIGLNLDNPNPGTRNVIIGSDSFVSAGNGSIVIGRLAEAENTDQIVMGFRSRATGQGSISLGRDSGYSNQSGTDAVSIGSYTFHEGLEGVALGHGADSTDDYSNVIGSDMTSGGANTTIIGSGTRTHLIAGSDANTNSYVQVDYVDFTGNANTDGATITNLTAGNITGEVADANVSDTLTIGSSSTIRYATKTVTTTNNTLATTDRFVHVDDDTAGAQVTINLPALSGNEGLVYHIKKIGNTSNVVVDGNGTEPIDGATTKTLTTQYESLFIVADPGSTNWWVH